MNDQSTDLSAQLLQALIQRDFEQARKLMEEGADANALVNPSGFGRDLVTPAAFAFSQMQLDILPALLGTGLVTVPIARQTESGARTTILDELVLAAGDTTFDVGRACAALADCFDCSAPVVANAMWNAAEKALGFGDAWPIAERIDCAKFLLRAGAYPDDAREYPGILGRLVEDTGDDPGIPFIRYFGDNDVQTHLNWIEHGFDIDAPIRGMPPLHHVVMNDDEGMLAFYLAAGADIRATCTFDAFTANAGKFDALKHVQETGVTAYDLARELGLPRLVQMLEVHAAKKRIDAIFSKSRKLNPP